MRISAYEGEDGYERFVSLSAYGARVTVWLDGVKIEQAEMADDVTGEVRRAKLDDKGRIYLEGDEIARETLRGHVVIEITKP